MTTHKHPLLTLPLLSAFALLPLLQTAPLWAQDWTGLGRLQGTVTDRSGRPLEDATVLVRPQRWTVDPANLEQRGNGTHVVVGTDPRTQYWTNGRAPYSETDQRARYESGPSPVKTDRNGQWSIGGLAPGGWIVTIEKDGFRIVEGPAVALMLVDRIKVAMDALSPEQLDLIRQRKQAIASLEQHLQQKPDDVGSRLKLVDLLVAAGRAVDAQPHLAALPPDIRLEPMTLLRYGVQFLDLGRDRIAYEAFNRLVVENPDFAPGYLYRGICFYYHHYAAEAKADLHKAIELRPDGQLAAGARQYLKRL